MIVKDLLHVLETTLSEGGISNPKFETSLFVEGVTGLRPTECLLFPDQEVSEQHVAHLKDLVTRRVTDKISVARLLGQRGFWSLEFLLSEETLEPRPDTEIMIEEALRHLASQKTKPLRILDIGTGSGCILLSLLAEFPHATGVGLDISAGAVEKSTENARLNGLEDRASFFVSDSFSVLKDQEQFDLIVSNPPYIPSEDIEELSEEVRLHDPRRALDGGKDGLDFYRLIAEQAGQHLSPQGWVILEFGQNQHEDVSNLMQASGFQVMNLQKDYGGIIRTITCQAAV